MKKVVRDLLRRIRNRYYRTIGYYSTELYGYNFKLNYENISFWKQASNGHWEPETFEVLSNFLNKNSTYIDIGAWIGPTVIYASKKCDNVICFEPDPVAYRRLTSNIIINKLDNVSSYNVAISDTSSIQKMSSLGGSLGDSMTSLLPNNNSPSSTFNALVLHWNLIENIYNFKKVDMLKIDIEGGEFSLIPKLEDFLKKFQPVVWLSFHVPFLEENKRLEKLQKIIDVMMRCYTICLNSKLEKFDINELKSDENMKRFPALLFKN